MVGKVRIGDTAVNKNPSMTIEEAQDRERQYEELLKEKNREIERLEHKIEMRRRRVCIADELLQIMATVTSAGPGTASMISMIRAFLVQLDPNENLIDDEIPF